MGVPRNHPFSIGFSVVNHPFWGTPILGSYRIEYFLDQWWFSWWFHSHVLFSTPGIGWWSPIRSIFFRWVVRRRSQVLGTFERMAPGYERCPDGSSMHTYAYTYAICIYICIYTLYIYGSGSIPINTIFSGMNIHLPAILMFTRGTRFWHTAIYIYITISMDIWYISASIYGRPCHSATVPQCLAPWL